MNQGTSLSKEQADGMMKEYEAGREEIRSTESAILQVLSIMLGASAVLIGQGIQNHNPWVFLLPEVLMIVTVFYVADKRWVIWTLATYQRARIENGNLGMQWETTLAAFRDGVGPKRSALITILQFRPAYNIMLVEFLMFILMGIVCTCLFCEYAPGYHLALGIYIAPLVVFVYLFWNATWQYLRLSAEGRLDSPLYKKFIEALEHVSSIFSPQQVVAQPQMPPPNVDATTLRRDIKASIIILPLGIVLICIIACFVPHQSLLNKEIAWLTISFVLGALICGVSVYKFMRNEMPFFKK